MPLNFYNSAKTNKMKTKIIFFCLVFIVFGMCSRSKQDEMFVDSILYVKSESVDSVSFFSSTKEKTVCCKR